jgi:hypothetical protein
MSSLQQQLDARCTAEPACIKTGSRDSAAFVEFHVSPHSRSGFPLGQLCHYTLESNTDNTGDEPPERLAFAFPTADVVVFGARLGKLVEAVNERSLASVMPLDARYADILGRQPWVARVTIARIDKANGAAG